MMITTRVLLAHRREWWAVGSKILMAWEGVQFSHCAIEIDGLVYESVWPEARVIKKAEWLKKYRVAKQWEKHISEELADEMESWFVDAVIGKTYSLWHLVTIGLTISSKKIQNLVSGREFDGSKALICTEAVGLWMTRFFNKKWNEFPDWLSLKDIENGASEVFE
jgi:hypothetical protein